MREAIANGAIGIAISGLSSTPGALLDQSKAGKRFKQELATYVNRLSLPVRLTGVGAAADRKTALRAAKTVRRSAVNVGVEQGRRKAMDQLFPANSRAALKPGQIDGRRNGIEGAALVDRGLLVRAIERID